MEYNLLATKLHPLARFTINLNTLIKEEGGKGVFDDNTVAISLDDAEKSKRKSSHNETMDIAVAVVKKGSSSKPKGEKVILCEFKLKCDNPSNVSMSEIENKIKHSKLLVQKDYLESIYDKYYFLFTGEKVNQARNYFSRRKSGLNKNVLVMTEQDFKELLF